MELGSWVPLTICSYLTSPASSPVVSRLARLVAAVWAAMAPAWAVELGRGRHDRVVVRVAVDLRGLCFAQYSRQARDVQDVDLARLVLRGVGRWELAVF